MQTHSYLVLHWPNAASSSGLGRACGERDGGVALHQAADAGGQRRGGQKAKQGHFAGLPRGTGRRIAGAPLAGLVWPSADDAAAPVRRVSGTVRCTRYISTGSLLPTRKACSRPG